MNRYYGVIKDRTTSDEFINKFLEAASLQGRYRDVVRNNVVLSDYTYLTTMGDASKAQMMQHLADTGYIKEAMSYEGELAVLDSLTRNPESANLTGLEYQNASIIRFASNLYLIVVRGLTAAEIEGGDSYNDPTWFNDALTQVKVLHVVPEEVTTTDPETGETTTTTVYRSTVFQLGSDNSNGFAPAVAYEITSTYSGDVLVKLAWCPNECAGTEENLKSVMSALDICTYTADIEGSGDAAHVVLKNVNGGSGHTAEVFGAGSARGGFLYNIMENGSYGLTIFNSDRTPLYTWSADAGAYDAVDSTGAYALNVNLGGFGRVISDEKVNESSKEYVIKMTALAPLFCPATKKKAKYAKWMPQGLHDYSYFDKSGHIRLKGSKSEDSVFFADHGVYLFDGPASNFSESSRMTPDAMPENLVVIKRPQPSSWLPYSGRFYAIFDCKDGLSRTGWFNTKEGGEAYDMTFVGSPTINADGSARFVNRATNPSSGWVTFPWGADAINHGSFSVVVFKYSYSGTRKWHWAPFICGDIFDTISKEGCTLENTCSGYMLPIFGDYNLGVHQGIIGSGEVIRMFNVSQDHWYILFNGVNGGSGGLGLYAYDLETGTALSQVNNEYNPFYNFMNWQIQNQQEVPVRFYFGGYPKNDSWKANYYQGQSWISSGPDAWASDWSRGNQEGGGDVGYLNVDIKFAALADWSGWSLSVTRPSDALSSIVNKIREHYGYT